MPLPVITEQPELSLGDGCEVKNDNMPFGNLFACGTCVMAKTAVFQHLLVSFSPRMDSIPKTETGRVSVAAHGRVRTYATAFPVTWQRLGKLWGFAQIPGIQKSARQPTLKEENKKSTYFCWKRLRLPTKCNKNFGCFQLPRCTIRVLG